MNTFTYSAKRLLVKFGGLRIVWSTTQATTVPINSGWVFCRRYVPTVSVTYHTYLENATFIK